MSSEVRFNESLEFYINNDQVDYLDDLLGKLAKRNPQQLVKKVKWILSNQLVGESKIFSKYLMGNCWDLFAEVFDELSSNEQRQVMSLMKGVTRSSRNKDNALYNICRKYAKKNEKRELVDCLREYIPKTIFQWWFDGGDVLNGKELGLWLSYQLQLGEQMIVSSDVLKGKKVEFARQDLDSVRVTLKRKEKDKDQYLAIRDLIEFEPSFYTLLYELICLMDIRDLKGIINLKIVQRLLIKAALEEKIGNDKISSLKKEIDFEYVLYGPELNDLAEKLGWEEGKKYTYQNGFIFEGDSDLSNPHLVKNLVVRNFGEFTDFSIEKDESVEEYFKNENNVEKFGGVAYAFIKDPKVNNQYKERAKSILGEKIEQEGNGRDFWKLGVKIIREFGIDHFNFGNYYLLETIVEKGSKDELIAHLELGELLSNTDIGTLGKAFESEEEVSETKFMNSEIGRYCMVVKGYATKIEDSSFMNELLEKVAHLESSKVDQQYIFGKYANKGLVLAEEISKVSLLGLSTRIALQPGVKELENACSAVKEIMSDPKFEANDMGPALAHNVAVVLSETNRDTENINLSGGGFHDKVFRALVKLYLGNEKSNGLEAIGKFVGEDGQRLKTLAEMLLSRMFSKNSERTAKLITIIERAKDNRLPLVKCWEFNPFIYQKKSEIDVHGIEKLIRVCIGKNMIRYNQDLKNLVVRVLNVISEIRGREEVREALEQFKDFVDIDLIKGELEFKIL